MERHEPRVQGRAFASAAAATFATNMVAAALSLANVLITARQLGPSGRGELAFLTTVAMLTAALSSFGVEEAHANLAATMPRVRRALASNSLAFGLVFGALAAGFVALLMALFPGIAAGSSPRLLVVAFVAIPILLIQLYLQFLVRADYGFTVANFATLAAVVLNFAVNALLAALGLITVGTALLAWLAGQLLATALLAAYVHRRLVGFGRPKGDLARESFAFGLRAHGPGDEDRELPARPVAPRLDCRDARARPVQRGGGVGKRSSTSPRHSGWSSAPTWRGLRPRKQAGGSPWSFGSRS